MVAFSRTCCVQLTSVVYTHDRSATDQIVRVKAILHARVPLRVFALSKVLDADDSFAMTASPKRLSPDGATATMLRERSLKYIVVPV
jgi:hypothetical protein